MKFRIKIDFFLYLSNWAVKWHFHEIIPYLEIETENYLINVTGIKVSKILLQFVLFYDTLTFYAENKRKRQDLQILVFTGVGLLFNLRIFIKLFIHEVKKTLKFWVSGPYLYNKHQ